MPDLPPKILEVTGDQQEARAPALPRASHSISAGFGRAERVDRKIAGRIPMREGPVRHVRQHPR